MSCSVAEIRRLLQLVGLEDAACLALHLHWSQWRREHQWQAQQAHIRRRTRQLATASLADASPDVPAALVLVGLAPVTLARWDRIVSLLPPQRPPTGRPASDHRQLLEGMLWVMATGTSWRQIPATFGPWQTIYSRFQRWTREGLWEPIRRILLS